VRVSGFQTLLTNQTGDVITVAPSHCNVAEAAALLQREPYEPPHDKSKKQV
jgi:hypothetical protein